MSAVLPQTLPIDMKGSSCNRPALVPLCMGWEGGKISRVMYCSLTMESSAVEASCMAVALEGRWGMCSRQSTPACGGGSTKTVGTLPATSPSRGHTATHLESRISNTQVIYSDWTQVMPLCTHETDVLLLKRTSDMFQFQKVNFFPPHSFTSI